MLTQIVMEENVIWICNWALNPIIQSDEQKMAVLSKMFLSRNACWNGFEPLGQGKMKVCQCQSWIHSAQSLECKHSMQMTNPQNKDSPQKVAQSIYPNKMHSINIKTFKITHSPKQRVHSLLFHQKAHLTKNMCYFFRHRVFFFKTWALISRKNV